MVGLLALAVVLAPVGALGGVLDHGHITQLRKDSEASQKDSAASLGLQPGRFHHVKSRDHNDHKDYHAQQGFPGSPNFRVNLNGETETEFLNNLWAGRDYPMGFFSVIGELSRYSVRQANVQIVGLPNSGTTLLRAILYANWGAQLNYFDEEVNFGGVNKQKGIYRHSNIDMLYRTKPESIQQLVKDQVAVVVVSRNPYAWLLSLREGVDAGKATIGMRNCALGDEWIWQPCAVETPVGAGDMMGMTDTSFGSPPEVWNQWTEGYLRAEKFGIHKRFLITYENLVLRPEVVLANFAKFMNIAPPHKYVVPFTIEGRKELMDRIIAGDITGNWPITQEKYQACLRLNPSLMKQFGYEAITCDNLIPAKVKANMMKSTDDDE